MLYNILMISVLDIGIGNINSVIKALNSLNIKSCLINDEKGIMEAKKIIFPGVGSFNSASKILHEKKIINSLLMKIEDKTPYLGICLGMQLLAEVGYEGNEKSNGIGYINGNVTKIKVSKGYRLPHIGWNEVNHDGSGIFYGIPKKTDFYFVHSYSMKPEEEANIFYTDYSEPVCAFVRKGSAFGVQFHPEKSQEFGLKLLKNFDEL